MKIITINERTKAGKTLFELATLLSTTNKGVSIETSLDKPAISQKKVTTIEKFTAKEDEFLKGLRSVSKDVKNIKNGTNKKKFQTLRSFLDEL